MDNTMNSNEDDDAEAMRKSFEAFMLSGKKSTADSEDTNNNRDDSSTVATSQSNKGKKKKKKKKKQSLTGGTSPRPPLSTPPSKLSMSDTQSQSSSRTTPTQSTKSKEKKRYYQLLRTFNDKVQHTWLDLDGQMLSILQNVVSIRSRLPLEWKILHSSYLKDENNGNNPQLEDEDEWKYYGVVGKPKEVSYAFHLRTNDVQLALSNDLRQHEKMLGGLRSLMTNLADCHDALGRNVDTIWKFHLECCTTEDIGDEDDSMQNIVDNVTEVYQMLSMELYRKQCMIPLIMESTQDEILGIEKGKHTADNTPKTARKCCNSWKRSSEASCIDERLITHVLKLGKTPQPKQ